LHLNSALKTAISIPLISKLAETATGRSNTLRGLLNQQPEETSRELQADPFTCSRVWSPA